MKINNSIIKVLLLGVVASAVSCTANYEDMNKNPYQTTDKEMDRDGYNTRAALIAMQNWVVPTDINACQFTDMLMGGSWGGYIADSNPGFNSGNFASYSAPENWMKVMYQDIIPKMYANYTSLLQVTKDEIPLSVALIIKVAGIHRISDAYGPIPYSKLGADGGLQAPLDSQEQAFDAMFADLDNAIATLTARQREALAPNSDKLFSGDIVRWIRFANSLKLRLAMRIVYASPAKAQQKAEEAVNHEIGVMMSNTDNAAYSGFGKDGNPFAKVMYEYNNGDARVGADITTYMNGYKDPRRASMFTVTTFTKDDAVAVNGFTGLRSGITIPLALTAQKYSNAKVSSSTPLKWMNSAEVAFLCAEGALRGWNMGGTAESFYKKGIELSFAQWDAAGADVYAADAVSVPEAYKDPLGVYNYGGTVSTVTIAWSASANFETNLERIITQKWIANFTLGQEAWAEYRRTGYPKLMAVVRNNSTGGIVDSNKGARRLPYPLDEYTTNGANVQAAVSAHLKGADNMATHVWWDCKPKN